jgi:cystathionine beta-lyase family protein involved in aluminum resistance
MQARASRSPVPLGSYTTTDVIEASRAKLVPKFAQIDSRTERMLSKVLETFRKHGLGSHHFAGVDGYGHGDLGRDALDGIFADLMGAEAALVRIQIMSGTHAIACALFGVLRPGDELLGVSGSPYDTLEEVIGLRGCTDDGLRGSLADLGVTWRQVELTAEGKFDLEAIDGAIRPATRMLHVQRSCGYAWRPSIHVEEIGRLARWLRDRHPSVLLFVDNCYGEFVEYLEPCHVGAHLVAGSLIKNPGGTLAPSGGYVAGEAKLVAAASNRLGAPGVEGGATLGWSRTLFQGLFHAPQVVGEALKGAELVATVMSDLGYPCNPPADAERTDIIQAVKLGSRDAVVAFCAAVQRSSPVGSHVRPIPGITPGYGDEVIFADGTFIDGSTLELSADGPLRPPFAVYVQGCTHWTHWSIVLRDALREMGGPSMTEGQRGGKQEDAADQEGEERRYAGRRTLKNSDNPNSPLHWSVVD